MNEYIVNNVKDFLKVPKETTHISFAKYFDKPFFNIKFEDGMTHFNSIEFPKTLTHFKFNDNFNSELRKIEFPDTITNLYFGNNFNQSIDQVKLPASLKVLILGSYFNKPLDKIVFPKSLKVLIIGYNFNQSLENITFPENLCELNLRNLIQPLKKLKLPKNLKKLYVGHNYNYPIDEIIFPNTLTHLSLGRLFNQSLAKVKFPESLTHLEINDEYHKETEWETFIPNQLTHLMLLNVITRPLNNLPPGLEKLVYYGDIGIIAQSKIPFGCDLIDYGFLKYNNYYEDYYYLRKLNIHLDSQEVINKLNLGSDYSINNTPRSFD